MVGGQWIVDAKSFQKICGLCGLKGHTVDKRRAVTLVDDGQRRRRNVKIDLEFWILNSQYISFLLLFISLFRKISYLRRKCQYYLCQGTGVTKQNKKHHSSFTSVEDLFASESEQFRGCAETLGRDLQISDNTHNTQVTHSLKQSTIIIWHTVFLEQEISTETFSMTLTMFRER